MLDRLPDDVRKELGDFEFYGRKHYSRSTYASGCHGPLCRKAERDRGRDRQQERTEAKGKRYRPNEGMRLQGDDLLDEIIDWYEGLSG